MHLTQAGAFDSWAALHRRRRALSVGKQVGKQKSVITMRGVSPHGGEERWRGLSGLEGHMVSLEEKRGHTAHGGHSQLPTQATWATAVTPTESPGEHLWHFSRSLPSLCLALGTPSSLWQLAPLLQRSLSNGYLGQGQPVAEGKACVLAPLRCVLGNDP